MGEEDEAPPRANPCEGLNTFLRNNAEVLERAKALTARLSSAAGRARGLFAAPALGRDYAQVDVLDVTVENGSTSGTFSLKTRARFEGCAVDLTIAGSSLSRTPRDFEWLRGCLRDEYPGCVVPPIASDVYANAPTAADAAPTATDAEPQPAAQDWGTTRAAAAPVSRHAVDRSAAASGHVLLARELAAE